MNILEAFKSFSTLNEEAFDIEDNDLLDAKELVNDVDDDDVIDIIDVDAETEDELKDSYVDKVILECPICHSLIYKDEDELVISEDEAICNVDDECPYCMSTDGYTIVGRVAPFNEASTDEEEEIADDDAEVEINVDVEDAEDADIEFDADEAPVEEGLLNPLGPIIKGVGKAIGNIGNSTNEELDEECEEEDFDAEKREDSHIKRKLRKRGVKESIHKRVKKDVKEGIVDTFDKIIADNIDEAFGDNVASVVNTATQNVSDVAKAALAKDSAVDHAVSKSTDGVNDFVKTPAAQKVVGAIGDRIAGKKDAEVKAEVNEDFNYVDVESDDQKLTMSANEDGKITIESEPVECIDACDEVIAPVSEDEFLDVEDAEEEEIPEEHPDEEPIDEVPEDDEIDVDLGEFDEESFDEVAEAYLRECYSNVDTFRTRRVSELPENKLKVEGVITFKSGKNRVSNFILEAKDATRENKIRFSAMNESLSKSKKPFTILGSVNENKFIAESLTYNYRQKNADGESVRLYGTVRKHK